MYVSVMVVLVPFSFKHTWFGYQKTKLPVVLSHQSLRDVLTAPLPQENAIQE